MALLNVPDKYAQERGGWKSDKIMKGTYMQTFKSETIAVDNKINEYFQDTVLSDSEEDKILRKKYSS